MVPKIVFIVPYRDRPEQKCVFERNMKHIMEDYQKDDFQIFFAEQGDTRPFNRGGIKNIGFIAIKNLYPNDYKNITFVFNDVDSFPYTKGVLDYQTKSGIIKHFFGFKHVLGGIFSITGGDFEKLNGFPNFWTWGYEDNMIYNKAVKHPDISVDRSTFFEIFNHNIVHYTDSLNRTINIKQTGNSKQEQNYNNINSLRNINYTIENDMIRIHNFSVSLPYKEDIRPYNAKLTQNMIAIKKKYRMAQRGITMGMGFGMNHKK
jgi:hypothetical protein